MSSLDTLYPINLSTPADVILEPYTNVPGNVEVNLGFVPRAFKGGTDFKIYTDSVGVTQLTESVDYELTVIDEYYTEQAEFDVYISFKIINPTHYNKNFWITSKVLGSYVDAAYHEGISQEGLFRNAIVDPGFLLWDAGTSFTNPTSGNYGPNMWKMGRSGVTPDQYILSRSTFVEDEHGPYSCKIEITTPGNSAAYSEVRQNVDNYEKFKGKNVSPRFRVYAPSGSHCQMIILDSPGSTTKLFTGIGDWQDVVVENYTIDSSATGIIIYFRFSIDGEIATSGDYYISNFQFCLSEKVLPFEQKKEFDVVKQASYYYEVIKGQDLGFGFSQLITSSVYIRSSVLPKRVAPTITLVGTETTDWNVYQANTTTPTTGFSFFNAGGSKNGLFYFALTKTNHGLTAGFFIFRSNSGYISFDARL